jgi:hypothetical protein
MYWYRLQIKWDYKKLCVTKIFASQYVIDMITVFFSYQLVSSSYYLPRSV